MVVFKEEFLLNFSISSLKAIEGLIFKNLASFSFLVAMESSPLSSRQESHKFHKTGPRGYKKNFMLNSTQHEIVPAHKC